MIANQLEYSQFRRRDLKNKVVEFHKFEALSIQKISLETLAHNAFDGSVAAVGIRAGPGEIPQRRRGIRRFWE